MENHARSYAWSLEDVVTADGYNLSMLHFRGDENGDRLEGTNKHFEYDNELQGLLRPVLITHTATLDCLDWLTSSEVGTDSIPMKLFLQGYDVFLGCRRGTEFSRSADGLDLNTPEGLELYFDYDTQTVGEQDVPAMVQRMVDIYNADRDAIGSKKCFDT